MNNKQNSERKITLALFKSEEFKNSLLEYLQLISKICLSHMCGMILVKALLISEAGCQLGSQFDGELVSQACRLIISICCFALLFWRKNIINILIFQSIALLIAFNQPLQALLIIHYTIILGIVFLIFQSSYNVSKSIFGNLFGYKPFKHTLGLMLFNSGLAILAVEFIRYFVSNA